MMSLSAWLRFKASCVLCSARLLLLVQNGLTLHLQLQELLPDSRQLAQLAPVGSTIQNQLGALASLHGRIKLGKPALTEHFHTSPDFASEEAYEKDLKVAR